jgi:hypothetical protein
MPVFLEQPWAWVYVWVIGNRSGHNGSGSCLKDVGRPVIRKVSRTW